MVAAPNAPVRQSIADLTTDIKTTKGEVPPPLVGSSTTVMGNDLYVFGGRVASNRQMTNYLYILHLPTLVWTRHIAPPDSAKPPTPRYFHSASLYKNRYIVLFGGMGNSSSRRNRQQQQQQQQQNTEEKLYALDDISLFDIDTMSWIEVNVPPSIFTPQARYAHLATIWNSDKLVIMGGQDIANTHINEINVFDLTELAWIHGGSINGPYDAYRAVAFCPSFENDSTSYGGKIPDPFWKVDTKDDNDKMEPEEYKDSLPPVCIYSNYNFNDLTRELQSFMPMKSTHNVEFHNHSADMISSILPPGLRFPTGHLMGHYFIISGTFLSPTQRGFQIWALNLSNLSWSHIDTGTTMAGGSWNRGVLSQKKYYVLGHGQRDLRDDYSYRRINFDHIAIIDLEAFGVYSLPPSTYTNIAQELGLSMLNEPGMSDLTIWTTDQQSISANSIILAERWPGFAQLLEVQATEAKTKQIKHTQIQRKQLLFPETYSVTLAFLQYIYTDHLITAQQHQPHILSRLLFLSDMYQLERLKQLSTYALHQLLTISTASMVYETATLTFQSALQIRALRIMMNAKRMLLGQQQQQQQLQQQQHNLQQQREAPFIQQNNPMGTHDQEWNPNTLPLSPSSSLTASGSGGSSYYSSEDTLSPTSQSSFSNLRRLAQPGMSPSTSEKSQQQRYMYGNPSKAPLSPPLGNKKQQQQGYFDQYNSNTTRSISSFI